MDIELSNGDQLMDQQIIAGLFTLAGALLGGLITIATTRLDRGWERAKRDIEQLCQQVSAFYQLELKYIEKVVELSAQSGLPPPARQTVMNEMRDQVQNLPGQVRPQMTTNAADRIRGRWN